MPRLLVFLLFWPAFSAPATPSAAEMARTIREAGLDPEACYRVRDLSFSKEDIRVYLTDGYLIFSKPVMGERLSAVFTADVEGGDGEVLLLPPYRGERQSMAAFTQSPNLDEHLRAALMIFTGGTARTLINRMEKEESGRKAPEMGVLLAEKWAPVVANVIDGFQMRLVEELMAASPHSSAPERPGLLFLAANGRQLGSFDVLYDPDAREQILAGQMVQRDGRTVYNVWSSFVARSVRTAAKAKPAAHGQFSLGNFRIDAALDSDLKVKATTRVSVRVGANPMRAFPFAIVSAMRVNSVRVDGAPAELFVRESVRGRALRDAGDDVFLVVTPDALPAGTEHEFEFEHEGAVITSAGNSVFYVGARATWYPHGTPDFATYDLTFRYPRRLTLVTPGDVVDDRVDGDWRITRRRTATPIRMAGFNLGDYEKVSGSAGGLTVEVYGNRHLESALQPRMRVVETLPQPPPVRPMRMPRPDFTRLPQAVTPVLPDPLARLRTVAEDISSSLGYFSGVFGPPTLKTLTVAPIPGTFGQGFPGLVYLSTLAYLDPAERPAAVRDPRQQVFFSDLMQAHEVAHQWWGNVVTTTDYQDEWLLESLSNYSALLWLQKKKGEKAVESVLEDYRNQLIATNGQGRPLESAGPVIWGRRLVSSGFPDAWRTITYEKGAWIMHMLRRRLGDERFLKMLAELRRRYDSRSVSTEQYRALVKEFLPPGVTAESIDTFFDNWVYSTGIPGLKLRYTVKGAAPSWTVAGALTQSGVDDDFSADVPLEIQFARGAPQTIWVRTAGDSASFSATLRQPPVRVAIAPAGVLAVKK